MLLGIIGDIHANIDALQKTLDAMERLNVHKIYCTGDVVGYGAAPSECIRLVQEYDIPCCCGNHDSYVSHPGQYNKNFIRPEASQVIDWTRSVLSKEELDWLANLPYFIETDGFLITHASCQPYPQWMYVTNPNAASMHLLFQHKKLCFTGHSHIPVIATHKPGKKIFFDIFHNMVLPKEGNVMVGVGAVGQPRDDDSRACAILYDTDEHSVTMLRVKYDIHSAQQRIWDNHLPDILATRLALGR